MLIDCCRFKNVLNPIGVRLVIAVAKPNSPSNAIDQNGAALSEKNSYEVGTMFVLPSMSFWYS